jgi:hypothetical protein
MTLSCHAGRRQPRQLSGVKRTSQFGSAEPPRYVSTSLSNSSNPKLTPAGAMPAKVSVSEPAMLPVAIGMAGVTADHEFAIAFGDVVSALTLSILHLLLS